jgi:hypothetical protein
MDDANYDSSPGGDSSAGSQDQQQSSPPPGRPEEYPVCRLPSDSLQLSCVVGELLLGYIAVQILFLGIPVQGVKLTIDNEDGAAQIPDPDWAAKHGWTSNDPNMTTDGSGCCTLGKRVPIGAYKCSIEYQNPARITTVEDPSRPFILILPIGRPYNDLYMQAKES